MSDPKNPLSSAIADSERPSENRQPGLARIRPSAFHLAAWVCAGVLLILVMLLHLLTALMAGLLVYETVRLLSPLVQRRLTSQRAHLIAVLLLSAVIVATISGIILLLVGFFHGEHSHVPILLAKVMEIIDQARDQVPVWAKKYLPDDAQEMRQTVSIWVAAHSGTISLAGREALQVVVHLITGMILGAMVALNAARPRKALPPLAQALVDRAHLLSDAFRRIVFAQIRISLLNTVFTALFLMVILRLAGVHLPLTKTMVVLTFVIGLLPVVGNLISNTVIVIISLSASFPVAIAALVFLIVIHKLEYFLNARIVGSRINARSWELLFSMLLFEAAFGLPGLVAAPVFYAYVKSELYNVGWV